MTRSALRDARRAFERVCLEIKTEYGIRATNVPCEPIHENSREWCAVLLHSEWSNFCRQVILASAALEPEAGGAVLPRVHQLRSVEDAGVWVVRGLGLRHEPNWGTAFEAVRAASALGIANLSQVSGALGATNSPANDLRILRNFIAHRNRGTALQFRTVWDAHGGTGPMRADVFLARTDAAGTALFALWVERLRLTAVAAAA